jgi:hypothetical protein
MNNTKTVFITRNNLFRNIPMILLNNIADIDENFIEDNSELYETPCEECKGEGEECDNCGGNGYIEHEIYQTFLVEVDKWEIERLASYGVKLGYSKLLDKYIYDFGTSWSAFSYSKEMPEDYELSYDETLKRETVY